MKKTLLIESDNADHLIAALRAIDGIGTDDEAVEETTTTEETKSADVEVDSDKMPWDAEIHSGNKGTNADGTWKARKGKADEAKAARAEFLAKGGNVEAPDTTDAPVPGDEVKAAPAAPQAPTAPQASAAPTLPADAPAPIDINALYGAINERMASGKLPGDELNALYLKHAGSTKPLEAGQELEVNETARAALYADVMAL